MKNFLFYVSAFWVALAFWLLIAAGNPRAQQMTQSWVPAGFQQLAPTSATALTVPQGSRMAILCALTAAFQWRDDGTAPTAAIGMNVATGTCLTYWASNLAAIQVISATGTVNVSYYR